MAPGHLVSQLLLQEVFLTFPERNDGSFHFSLFPVLHFSLSMESCQRSHAGDGPEDPQGRQNCWASPRRRRPSCLRVQRYGNFSVPPNLSATFFHFFRISAHFFARRRIFSHKERKNEGREGEGDTQRERTQKGGGIAVPPLPYLIYIRAREKVILISNS